MEVLEERTTEIGSYPEDWSIDRVDAVFDLIQGKQVSERNRVGDNQRPFLRTKNVFWNRLELNELDQMHFTAAEEARYALKPGDLLLCEGGDVGRTAMWNGEVDRCYIQNHLHRLRAFDGVIDPQYAVFWFWYAFNVGNLYIGRGNKTTIPNMSRSKLAELPIASPRHDEQQRIAQVLSTVQAAIEQQERLIRTTTELKQALMQKLFTEGLRGEAQKETEIGLVPESWDVVKVMDTGTVVTGSTPSTSREDFYGGEYNLISPGDLDVTKYVTTVQKKLTALGFDQCRKLPKGAVLVGCIGNVGKVGIVADDRSATNQQINAIIPNDTHNGEFLYYAMDFHRNRLESLAGKVTIPLVNKSNFERFEIAVPVLADQEAIAKAIDAVDQRIAIAQKKHNALQALFRTLLHELMTGKVRVCEMALQDR